MAHIILPPPVETSVENLEPHRGPLKRNAVQLAAWILERLEKLYPQRKTEARWAVRVDVTNGFFVIQDVTMLNNYGYMCHFDDLTTYDDLARMVMRAGGEILERTLSRQDCEGLRFVTRVDSIPEKHQPVVPETTMSTENDLEDFLKKAGLVR